MSSCGATVDEPDVDAHFLLRSPADGVMGGV